MYKNGKKIYTSEEEYLHYSEDENQKKPFSVMNVIAIFFSVFIAIIILTMVMLGIQIKDTYHIFTKKRVAEMESKFGIIVDDNIKLKKYNAIHWLDSHCELFAENIDDPQSFMENNVRGEIISYEEYDGKVYYRYKFSRNGSEIKHSVIFEKAENGKYNAIFT